MKTPLFTHFSASAWLAVAATSIVSVRTADAQANPRSAPGSSNVRALGQALDYFEGPVRMQLPIDPQRVSLRFVAGFGPVEIRQALASLPGLDASKAAETRLSGGRRVLAHLTPGLDAAAAEYIARNLNTHPALEYALPAVLRDGAPCGLTDRIVVALRDGVSDADARRAFSDRGLAVIEEVKFEAHGYLLSVPRSSERLGPQEAQSIWNLGVARYAVPDLLIPMQQHGFETTPNDTLFPQQWHLHSVGQNSAKPDADVDAVEAWGVSKGSSSIVVAILDDGIQITHPDLAPNIVAGYDFSDHDSNPSPDAYDNHGTAVAGVACARGGNGFGVSGIARECRVMPIRMLDSTIYEVADAFRWAADNGADVISCSWGYIHNGSFTLPSVLKSGLDYAATTGRSGKGCAIFFSAGNDSKSIDSDELKSYSKVIAIAASTDQDKKAGYSNYGSNIDLCAPSNGGSNGVTTTDRTGSAGYSYSDYTSNFGGTSSACPLAAGVAALALSVNPSLSRTELVALLQSNADKIDPSGGSYGANGHSLAYGYGKVNAKRVVDAASGAGGGNGSSGGFQTFFSSGGPISIPDNVPTFTTSSIVVSGTSGSLLDLNVTVDIQHSYVGDLQVRLVRPDGVYVWLHKNSGGNADDIKGTYDTTLTPWQSLSGLAGGTANGTWRLECADFAGLDVGQLNSWSLELLSSGSGGLTTGAFPATDVPIAIPDNNHLGAASYLSVSGMSGTIVDVDVDVEIQHTYHSDVNIWLIRPDGLSVLLFSHPGGIFTGSVPISGNYDGQLTPKESMSKLFGGLPNGTWTLKCTDDVDVDVGHIAAWTLHLKTSGGSAAPPSWKTIASTDVHKSIPDAPTTGISAGTISVLNVNGVDGNLIDARIHVDILHPWRGDLSLTLVRPDGKSILLREKEPHDNTPNLKTVFGVQSQPVDPISSILGGSPNGTWKLKAVDHFSGYAGVIEGWSLEVLTSTTLAPQATLTAAFSFGSMPKSIPDGKGKRTLKTKVKKSALPGAVQSVVITLDIDHPQPTDLRLTLVHPDGTGVVLVKSAAFDPSTTFPTMSVPLESLAAFAGKPTTGTWKLIAEDLVPGGAGVVRGGTLRLTSK